VNKLLIESSCVDKAIFIEELVANDSRLNTKHGNTEIANDNQSLIVCYQHNNSTNTKLILHFESYLTIDFSAIKIILDSN